MNFSYDISSLDIKTQRKIGAFVGAIVGDVVGSSYERSPTKSLEFELFRKLSRLTDDSVLTIAVADWILSGGKLHDYFHRYVARYPFVGYGRTFKNWARS